MMMYLLQKNEEDMTNFVYQIKLLPFQVKNQNMKNQIKLVYLVIKKISINRVMMVL